jgi:hypothetical protein
MIQRSPYPGCSFGNRQSAIRTGGWKILFGACAVALSLTTGHAVGAATRAETLQSIHWVENPSDSARPGRCGELGAYQFRPGTWAMHTQKPFSSALNRRTSDEIAVLHYEWLKQSLVRAGVEPSTYNIALAWNAGVSAVIKGRAPAVSHDYATRVSNLATDMRSHQLAAN